MTGRRTPVACGIDAGSTNVKVVLVRDGEVLARVSRPTPLDPSSGTVDPMALVGRIEDLVLEACGSSYAVASVCAAGTGEDGVLVDAELEPMCPALVWHAPGRADLLAAMAPDLGDVTGLPVATDAARTVVSWAWARRAVGDDLARARSWVALTDLASARWTGREFLSDGLAARTAAWRTTDRTFVAHRVAGVLGDPALLPPVLRGGDVVGELRSRRLREVTHAGALVVAGGHDHPVGAWGVRRLDPRAVLDSMGTAEVIVGGAATTGQLRDADIDVGPSLPDDPGDTVLQVEELDRNVRWASRETPVAAALQDLLAGTAQPDRWVGYAAFVPGSRAGGAPRFADGAPADPLSRASAVLGALAGAGARAVDAVAARSGGEVTVFAAGGWSRSPGWMRVKQRHGAVRTLREPEVTAVGAAALGARATGEPVDLASVLSPD